MFIPRRLFSSVPRDLRMPTPFSRGHGLQYRKNTSSDKTKRLAVVVGWMGAKDSQLKSYLSFYHQHGYDTLSFAVGPKHVLFPDDAMSFMNSVITTALEVSNEHIKAGNADKPLDVVFHSFSMGGYLFGQSLRCMAQNPDKFSTFPSLIKAQVFDSPPDRQSIAIGISKSVGVGKPVEKMVEGMANMYLKATENTSGREHKAASEAFHSNYISAPSLWFYSYADPISRHEDCKIVINKWKESGTYVEECTWDDTPHIQHGRVYPEKYFGTLETFLRKFELLDGTANAGVDK